MRMEDLGSLCSTLFGAAGQYDAAPAPAQRLRGGKADASVRAGDDARLQARLQPSALLACSLLHGWRGCSPHFAGQVLAMLLLDGGEQAGVAVPEHIASKLACMHARGTLEKEAGGGGAHAKQATCSAEGRRVRDMLGMHLTTTTCKDTKEEV